MTVEVHVAFGHPQHNVYNTFLVDKQHIKMFVIYFHLASELPWNGLTSVDCWTQSKF